EEHLESIGMTLLDSSSALEAFYRSMFMKKSQVMLLNGDPDRLNDMILNKNSQKFRRAEMSLRRKEMQGLGVENCLEWDLVDHVSSLTKIPREELDIRENMTDFGLDSISLTKLSTALTKHFG